jgi:archaeal flagellar protein FlaG
MAGNVASETIFFIGAVVVATGLVAAFAGTVGDLSQGVQERGTALAKTLRTDIAIINDPMNVPTSPLVLYVKNVGHASLLVVDTNVFLDGTASADLAFDVLSSDDDATWRAGEVLKIAVASGDHRVRVVAATGVAGTLEFHVP